jgi:hypothetical protein
MNEVPFPHHHSNLHLVRVQNVLRLEHNSILREQRRKKSSVPIKPHLLEMQALRRPLTTALPNDRNHSDRNASIRFLGLVAEHPEVANVLSVDLARAVVTLDLDKVHPVVMDAFEDAKELLHPRPHLLAAMVDCVVLVVKGNVLEVEFEAGADVVTLRVDRCDVLLEEPLRWCRGAVLAPLGSGDVADEFGHVAMLETQSPGCR